MNSSIFASRGGRSGAPGRSIDASRLRSKTGGSRSRADAGRLQRTLGNREVLRRLAGELPANVLARAPEDSKGKADARAEKQPAPAAKRKQKKPPNPCTRTILAEGTCKFLVENSRFICCDPDNGYERAERSKDIDDADCPSHKFTPIFTCDSKCPAAVKKGCDDDDNWMAIPGDQFSRAKCGDVYTICANGKRASGYVRDRSVTGSRYEVSPGIQKALGVTPGDSFQGAVYRPGAKQKTIDGDPCCKA